MYSLGENLKVIVYNLGGNLNVNTCLRVNINLKGNTCLKLSTHLKVNIHLKFSIQLKVHNLLKGISSTRNINCILEVGIIQ